MIPNDDMQQPGNIETIPRIIEAIARPADGLLGGVE
jgi:hypothetical protein